jgi:hypothetical protein
MRLPGAIAAGLILAALLVVPARAAECWTSVTPDTAAPGEEVIVEIHKLGCDFWGGDLYLVPESSYESLLAQGRLCSAMAGALLIGPIHWVHDNDNHTGVIRFGVPDVADGVYVLGEDLPDVLPHCDRNGSLTVASGGPPDTAIQGARSGVVPTTFGLALLLTSIHLAWKQRRSTVAPRTIPAQRRARARQ